MILPSKVELRSTAVIRGGNNRGRCDCARVEVWEPVEVDEREVRQRVKETQEITWWHLRVAEKSFTPLPEAVSEAVKPSQFASTQKSHWHINMPVPQELRTILSQKVYATRTRHASI